MNRTHIETFSYQLSPQYYFNRLLKIWLHNNWGWLLSFFLLLVGLSIQNPLFIYVGLIILFLVFPMIISYLWFAYALHPDCRMSILSKTVEINKNGLSCTFDDGRTESIAWKRITPYTLYLDRRYLPLVKLYFFHFTIQFVQIE